MGVRYKKYRSIAIPLNIGIELSQVSRYFDISNIEPALVCVNAYVNMCFCVESMYALISHKTPTHNTQTSMCDIAVCDTSVIIVDFSSE